jgi:hypothetical protein
MSVVRRGDPSLRRIRDEQAARLPGWMQPFLTWLSCLPHSGQRQWVERTPTGQLAEALFKLAAGIWLALFAVQCGGWSWLVLPVAWMFTVGGARHLQVNIVHQCIHSNFSGRPAVDRWVGQWLTALVLVQDFDGYFADHVGKHHKKSVLTTSSDPDMAFLIDLGFRPGMSRRALWWHLAWTVVSPDFHAKFLWARLYGNFVYPHWTRAVAAAAIWALVLTAAVLSGTGLHLAFVALIPLGPLYHVSSLLQFISEHYWLRTRAAGETAVDTIARSSHGRFLIAPLPAATLPLPRRLVGWAWWASQTTAMTVVRFTCLVADLPVHDWHHLFQADRNWANALWEREWRVRNDPQKGPMFKDTRGLLTAIDRCLTSISEAPNQPVAARPNSGYLGM